MLAKEVKEFCSETSIHGLGQIANGQYSILKRLLWFAIFAGCLAYAGNQLVNSVKGNGIETKKITMVIWVVEFSNGGYKIRKVFYSMEIIEF